MPRSTTVQTSTCNSELSFQACKQAPVTPVFPPFFAKHADVWGQHYNMKQVQQIVVERYIPG